MSFKKCRILFFSDPHFSVDSMIEEERWFLPMCDLLAKISKKSARKFLDFWDKATQRNFMRAIKIASEIGPYDLAIGLGDYTPGANESGMIDENALDSMKNLNCF